MNYIDKKYINLLSGKLEKFKWIGDTNAVCRCPLCGDSQKNKLKRRGSFYSYDGLAFYNCFKCGKSQPFKFFLKELDHNLYQEYSFELFKNENNYSWNTEKVEKQEIPKKQVKTIINTNGLYPPFLVDINRMAKNHFCVEYCLNRKIPPFYYDKLFFSDNYMKWINSNINPEVYKKYPKSDSRLVIPFYDEYGKIFAYQGRALYDGAAQRYLTEKVDKDKPLIYGLNTVKWSQDIVVTEGPLDSMFLNNAMAVAGSGLEKLLLYDANFIFAYDNQNRSREIINLMQNMIDRGKNVVIWPSELQAKDINDMVLSGLTKDEIMAIISDNTFSGIKAQLKFNEWKRV